MYIDFGSVCEVVFSVGQEVAKFNNFHHLEMHSDKAYIPPTACYAAKRYDNFNYLL